MGGRLRPPFGTTVLGSALIAVASPAALAQTTRSSPQDATSLSGVTVVARPDLAGVDVNGRRLCRLEPPPGVKPAKPHVVDSYPKPGESPPAGVLYMRVTYSERMSPCGFLLADSFLTAAPEYLEEPALITRDYKTFYFAVKTEPGKTYAALFNRHFSAPFFRSIYGEGAPPFEMKFTTSSTAPPSTTMAEALAADPASPTLAPDPKTLIALWVPREGGDGPDCGACDKDALATAPKNLDEARTQDEPKP